MLNKQRIYRKSHINMLFVMENNKIVYEIVCLIQRSHQPNKKTIITAHTIQTNKSTIYKTKIYKHLFVNSIKIRIVCFFFQSDQYFVRNYRSPNDTQHN